VICARLLLPSASDTESALLQRVERIETRLEMSIPLGDQRPPFARPEPAEAPTRSTPPAAVVEPAPEPVPPPPAPEQPPPEQSPGEPGAAAVRTLWPTVRDKVRQRSRTTEVMLAGATVRAVEGNTLVLSHESAPLAKRLCEQRNADVIAEALKDALGVDWRVRCEAGAPNLTATEQPAVPAQRAEEESMLAEAGQDDSSAPRRDPEEAALELLQNELGARRIDNG
jgi:DNA polymerase III subunit gamma/tau